MAKEQEQQQVEKNDPIVESVVEETLTLQEDTVEEGVEASEDVSWQTGAKMCKSMSDNKTAEQEDLSRE